MQVAGISLIWLLGFCYIKSFSVSWTIYLKKRFHISSSVTAKQSVPKNQTKKVSSPASLKYPSSPGETDGVCTVPGRSPAWGFARPTEEASSVKNTPLLVSAANVTEAAA